MQAQRERGFASANRIPLDRPEGVSSLPSALLCMALPGPRLRDLWRRRPADSRCEGATARNDSVASQDYRKGSTRDAWLTVSARHLCRCTRAGSNTGITRTLDRAYMR